MSGGDWVQLLLVVLIVGVAVGYLGARAVALWRGRSGGCGSSCPKSPLGAGQHTGERRAEERCHGADTGSGAGPSHRSPGRT